MDWKEIIDGIEDKEDFVEFINKLSVDSVEHESEWENKSISDYLERIASWIEDYSICPANDIDWSKIDFRTLAMLFYVGKIYE